MRKVNKIMGAAPLSHSTNNGACVCSWGLVYNFDTFKLSESVYIMFTTLSIPSFAHNSLYPQLYPHFSKSMDCLDCYF